MIRTGPRRLADGKFVAREFTRADAADVYRWRSEVAHPEFFFHSTLDPETHRRFVESYFADDNEDAWFIIEDPAGRPIGSISLYHPRGDAGRWEAGRMVVAPEKRGFAGFRLYQGATGLGLEWARRSGVREVWCEVLEQNRIALEVVRRAGFREVRRGARDGRPFVELRIEF